MLICFVYVTQCALHKQNNNNLVSRQCIFLLGKCECPCYTSVSAINKFSRSLHLTLVQAFKKSALAKRLQYGLIFIPKNNLSFLLRLNLKKIERRVDKEKVNRFKLFWDSVRIFCADPIAVFFLLCVSHPCHLCSTTDYTFRSLWKLIVVYMCAGCI